MGKVRSAGEPAHRSRPHRDVNFERPRIRARGVTVVVAILAISLFALDSNAHADRGVSVDLGQIAVDRDLSKGGTYTLPTIGVRNPGDELTRYRMTIDYLTNQDRAKAPAGWFTFNPTEFELAPGETQPVRVEMSVPPSAKPDNYAGLVQASIVADASGVTVGASAATRLTFTVKPSSLLEAWLLRIRGFVEENLLPVALVGAAAALGGAGWWAKRTFSFRLERR